jgi:hypothetical protein
VSAPRRSRWDGWLPWILLGACCLYAPGLHIPYFADDFQIVFSSPGSKILYFFAHPNPDNHFYRPIEAACAAAFQGIWGLDTLPGHLLILAIHLALGLLVARTARRLGCSPLQASLAATLMLVSQANALAVLSNDTLSQVCCTLFGYVAVICYAHGLLERHEGPAAHAVPPAAWRAAGVGAFLIALFSKETAVSFLPILAGLAAAEAWWARDRAGGMRRLLTGVLPLLAGMTVYLCVRSWIVGHGPVVGPGRYDFHFGANVLLNSGLLLAVAVLPLSSVTVILALQSGDLGVLTGAIACGAVIGAVVLSGIRKHPRRKTLAAVAGVGWLALCPMVALNHVSELYDYNAMPCIAILVGAGLGRVVEAREASRLTRSVGLALVAALVLAHGLAVRSKTDQMRANGDRASVLIEALKSWIGAIPEHGILELVNPKPSGPAYSAYLMNGFDVLSEGMAGVAVALGREDLQVQISEADGPPESRPSDPALSLTLRNGSIVPYASP